MRSKFLIFFMLSNFCFGITLEDITSPCPLMGRINHTDKIEIKEEQVVIEETIKKDFTAQNEKPIIEDIKLEKKPIEQIVSNYAQLSLKRLADDIAFELEEDETKLNSDLSALWAATMARSETLKYTIYKLSNPDEDKPNDNIIKKIIKPIANLGSMAGASVAGDPILATSALIGGGLVNAFMKDDKEMNYQFSKVSDADMVLLIRKVDSLQKKLIDLYVDYRTKEGIYNLEKENLLKREQSYKISQNKSKEELTIADVYFRNAKTRVQKAQDEFMTSRAILENLVGVEAIEKIEEQSVNS